jgi:hypothetical protein
VSAVRGKFNNVTDNEKCFNLKFGWEKIGFYDLKCIFEFERMRQQYRNFFYKPPLRCRNFFLRQIDWHYLPKRCKLGYIKILQDKYRSLQLSLTFTNLLGNSTKMGPSQRQKTYNLIITLKEKVLNQWLDWRFFVGTQRL